MFTEIRRWTLADSIDDAGYDRLVAELQREFGRFVREDGQVEFPIGAIVARANEA